MEKSHLLAVLTLSLAILHPFAPSRASAEDPLPEGPIAEVAVAAVEGKYEGPGGDVIEISDHFEEATWGQVFTKLAGANKITWTQTEPNDAGTTGVQATFQPAGAPPEIIITMFLLTSADGIRFDRMRMTKGEESLEKSGIEALEDIAKGYGSAPAKKGEVVAVLNKNQLKQLALGCYLYASDNEDAFPPDLAALVDSGALEEKLQWRHPETGVFSDFLYHGKGKSTAVPAATIIVAAPQPIDGKRTVAQADGAVLDIPEPTYQEAIR